MKVAQSCPTLCDPMDYTVQTRILQTRILGGIAFPFSKGFSQPRDQTQVSCIASESFTIWETRDAPLFTSVQFSRSVVSDSLQPHGLQHARPSCPLPTSRVYSNSCPLSQWCHPTIPSSVIPFSSCLQSFPASGSFPMSQFFLSGGENTGVSASTPVLPMNIQGSFPLGNTHMLFYT